VATAHPLAPRLQHQTDQAEQVMLTCCDEHWAADAVTVTLLLSRIWLAVTVSCPPAAMLPLAGLSRKPPPLSAAVRDNHDSDVPLMLATVN
jgi:hypothetical protein